MREFCFLLTGLAKSGKSTIDRIAFGAGSSSGSVTRPIPFLCQGQSIRMKIVDLPDTGVILEHNSPAPYDETLFEGCVGVIFVVDITSDYVNALTKLCALAVRSRISGVDIPFEVLLHKSDSMDEQEKEDVLKDISLKAQEEIAEICESPPSFHFHLTSIFDHTLALGLGQILQRHLKELSAFETLLDVLCMNSMFEKAFIFDNERRLSLATDPSPFGLRSFELAREALDMFSDLKSLYPGRPKGENLDSLTNSFGELKLSNDIVVGYYRVSEYISIIYLMNGRANVGKLNSIQHNLDIAKGTIEKVLSSSV